GGLTCKVQRRGTTPQAISDLHFIDSKTGWAVTPQRRDGGFLLHTTDSGNYWKIQEKTNQPAIAVHFSNDGQNGWLLLADASSLLTSNGGKTWKRQQTDFEGRINRVSFLSDKQAWAFTNSQSIIMTKDRGISWRELFLDGRPPQEIQGPTEKTDQDKTQFSIAKNDVDEFQTLLEKRGMENSRFNRVASNQVESSERSPKNKTKESDVEIDKELMDTDERPIVPNRTSNQNYVKGVFFLNEAEAWSVGESGNIHKTQDGGATWQRKNGGERYENLEDVLFLSQNNGWVSGEQGTLMETKDGGHTWHTLNSGTRQELVGVHFVGLTPKWGWVMRKDGTVHYTTDGDKWSPGKTPMRPPLFEEEPPTNFRMNDASFGKFSEGWAAGSDGQIIHNQDGGPIWTPQRTSTGKDLVDIEMKFAPLGWAVGHSGIVQRTVNGGQYWKHHETDTGYDLFSVNFIKKRVGWAVGQYGIVLRTNNGGFKWEALSSGTTTNLNSIISLSEQELYAVGDRGLILYSSDAGDTWQQQHTDIDNDLYTIVCSEDKNTLWIVGQWGIILKRSLAPQLSYRKGNK
ncbi:YCF48-related protein, partial [Candidatus Poribacteria bacterium]|nr:YCF48-related protein [Candidatus Poribacteria bacterium]